RPRAARALRRRGAPRQPDLRRRGDDTGAAGRRRDRGDLVRGDGLLDQSRLGERAARRDVRAHGHRRARPARRVRRADVRSRPGGTRRGTARRRRRLRRGREVSGPGQVRATVMDGVQGRDGTGGGRRRRPGGRYGMTAAIADVEEALKDVVDRELGINVAVPVGAIAVLLLGRSARTSLVVGAGAGLGAATADGIYAAVAAMGGAAVAGLVRPVAGPLRWLAAAVLLGLAVRTAATAWRDRARAAAPDRVPVTPGRAYLGVLP